jgi:hypothetical protein
MGQIFELKTQIDQFIQQKGLDAAQMRGKIGMKAGVLLTMINADSPDDATKLGKLKLAAEEVLGQKF